MAGPIIFPLFTDHTHLLLGQRAQFCRRRVAAALFLRFTLHPLSGLLQVSSCTTTIREETPREWMTPLSSDLRTEGSELEERGEGEELIR